jgi:hypothetical protein
MPDYKITELPAYTSASSGDVFPIVDITTLTTKKITYSDVMSLPHAMYSSASTQVCNVTSASFAIRYSDVEMQHNISCLAGNASGSSKVSIAKSGMYLIAFSAVGKSTTANATLDIWLRVNGSNVDRSNTLSRFVGSANERIITVAFFYNFVAGDYFELAMHSDTSGTNLVATGSTVGPPVVPACPSIITTINKIALSTG